MMSDKLKGAVKSKLVWLGMLLAIAGVIQANMDVFAQYLTPEAQGLATVGVGIAVVVLRFLTTMPLDEK